MGFMTSTRVYWDLFYFAGMSAYRPIIVEGKHHTLHSSIIFVLLQMVLSITLGMSCIIILLLGKHPTLSSTVEMVIIYMCTLCEMARSVFLLCQYFMYKPLISDILATFQKLELYFLVHMKHRLQYDQFRRQFSTKICIVIVSFVLYIIIYVFRCLLKNYFSPIGTQLRILHLMTILSTLHITFYVDALSFHLDGLNTVVKRDIGQWKNFIRHNSAVYNLLTRNKIKCYKNVHFRLWESAEKLNTSFGWIMVTIILQDFVDFVYSSVSIIIEAREKSALMIILR